MLELWTNPWSSNGSKVELLLRELDLDYQARLVSLARPRPDDYLQRNPLGGIPTLRDGELVLAESQAILRYLASREARDDLYPSAAADRALVDEFLDRFATTLRTQLFRREIVMLGWTLAGGFNQSDADPDAGPAIEAEIQGALATLERIVGVGGAVLGRFTIADCALTPVLQRAVDTSLDLSGFPRLTALSELLLTRPGWQAVRAAGGGR
jgi:glutathione S-transferase